MSIWILVGDASEARLFEAEGVGTAWRLIGDFSHPQSRSRGPELVTERLGRQDERGELPRDLEANRFALELAQALERGLSQSHYDRLILVGPSRFLGELRRHLGSPVLERLTDTLHKDYAKLKQKALEQRVHDQLLV